MADLQLIQQLRDIHLPPQIGVWPMALGWWFVLIFLSLSFFLAIKLWNLRKPYLLKRYFLSQLRDYKQDFEIEKNKVSTLNKLAILLKQVALINYPRQQVASLHGQAWVTFLQNTSPKGIDLDFLTQWFTQSLYQKNTQIEVELGFKFTEFWIKKQRMRCMN